MLLTDFKNTVDRYPATISSTDHVEACRQLNIDISKGYGRNQVSDPLKKLIKESLILDTENVPDKIPKIQLKRLQAELVYKHILYGENPFEYLPVLRVILELGEKGSLYVPPFSDTDKWEQAIINSKNYNNFFNPYAVSPQSIYRDYPKEIDRANSVKLLIDKGCIIEFVDSDIKIKSGLDVVAGQLCEMINTFGGITLIRSLFYSLSVAKRYSARFERYFITREANFTSVNQKPQIPFGYLLNLSLKYPHVNNQLKNPQKLFDEIIELAKSITNGAYGVQPYNIWEFHFHSGETIMQFCTTIALWDTIFSIPQCKPATALEITDNIFSFISETTFNDIFGFNKSQLISVAREINSIVSNPYEPTVIYLSTLSIILPAMDKNTIQLILDFLSHNGTVNEKYLLPDDYSSIIFFKKPLIKKGDTKFLLINKSWCAPNYFEAVISKVRDYIVKPDDKIGNSLEELVKSKLAEKGISFSFGKYKTGNEDGECDILIESEKAIIIIECKKKVLTANAKSGIDINLLLDLTDSILYSQIQAGKTEILLREQKAITLKDKEGNETTVNFNDRQIERVSLTQLEYGGFQDRTIIKQFLIPFLTHTFTPNSTDTEILDKFLKLNKKQKEWIKQYDKLCSLVPRFSHAPYFNCGFLSLPQIFEVINISTDNNSFFEAITKTKYVTMGSLDWYKEFDMATKLVAKPIAPK